uniref:Uncharacterized protein n=1 Tax=Arundo donax TaxID=35708 RepID=A0A0A9AU23_ARUDO
MEESSFVPPRCYYQSMKGGHTGFLQPCAACPCFCRDLDKFTGLPAAG